MQTPLTEFFSLAFYFSFSPLDYCAGVAAAGGGGALSCLLGPCRAGLPMPRGNEAGGSKVPRSSFYYL